MSIKRMTGVPWHVEKATRRDGDERRHKSRCVYYRKSDSFCSKYVGKCGGSAHCEYYSEIESSENVNLSGKNINTSKCVKEDGKKCQLRLKNLCLA